MQPLVALVQCGFAHLSYETDTPATRGEIASFDPSTGKRFHSQPLFHRRWLAGEQAISLIV